MPRDRSLLTIYLAVIFGCLYPFVVFALEPYITLLAHPMGSTAREIGITKGTFKIINAGFWPLIYTVIPGIIFGLPLGVLARSNWLRAWVLFVVASVGTSLACALVGEYGYSEFLEAWRLPGQWGLAGFTFSLKLPATWLTSIGIALFFWLGSRLHAPVSPQGHDAP
jgi:hypothetical protein